MRAGFLKAGGAAQGVTRAFTQGAKFVSASSAPHIAFMGACVVDLHGLDAGEAYQHAFGHIRQLAATLRGALSNRTKDAFREVYCWQTVCCLELWARLISAHADKEARTSRLISVLCLYRAAQELRTWHEVPRVSCVHPVHIHAKKASQSQETPRLTLQLHHFG